MDNWLFAGFVVDFVCLFIFLSALNILQTGCLSEREKPIGKIIILLFDIYTHRVRNIYLV